MSSPPKKSDTEDTSFTALSSPAYDPKAAAARERDKKKQKTDFRSLKKQLGPAHRRREGRTPTDWIIDAAVPIFIWCLMISVVFYLLNVRWIYSEVEHVALRIFAFCVVLGVVALNRVVAKDNVGDSIPFVMALAMVTVLYTLLTSTVYDMGSVAGGFMDGPWVATFFNLIVVIAVWWTTNRLMYECCIDENKTAGDVGILTGTLRDFRRSIMRDNKSAVARKKDDYLLPSIEISAYDPHDFKGFSEKKAETPQKPTARLGRRHPGVSIFYITVPAMLIFSLGLSVLQRGGHAFVLAGHVYVGLFIVSALLLLLLTSLSGIRQYFRARQVALPSAIGVFWGGLGVFMVIAVCVGAYQLPLPSMPSPAYIPEHEVDPWASFGGRFELTPYVASTAEQIEQHRIIDGVSVAVLAVMVLFGLYALIRGIGMIAAGIGRERDAYPAWVVKLFEWLDRVLAKLVTLPDFTIGTRHARPSAANALSTKFRNPMAGEGAEGKPEDVRRYVAHAFDALCALGEDMGRPRRKDETPYEFLRHLPREMTPLKKEAAEVIELYVRSAYSTIPPDAAILDRMRKFWFEFERVRNKYLR